MHWSEELAQQVIARHPEKEEYVCAAGISPSGSIHIGNFRDVATSLFVVKALQKQGKRARLLFSWDEFDRMRKVPVNVAQVTEGYEKYIGAPYVDVPNPFGGEAANYAVYFENEFIASMERFGIDMDYRYQGSMYREGKYREQIIHSLRKRREIFDILASFKTQESTEQQRENYYPVSIYCPVCGRDLTTIDSFDDETVTAHYHCDCGHEGVFDFNKDTNCKLVWKVDWAMRWQYEGVDFEPGGKDHASPGGSYDTSRVIAKEIFGYEAPLFQGYEFIGIKGSTGKMSGSSGLNLTPDTLLRLYQPEIILWLYSKTDPTKAFDFCFDDGILRQYFEFDRQYNEFMDGKANEHMSAVMDKCLVSPERLETVPMGLLVQLGSVVDFNVPMLETVFAKLGTPYKYEQFADRLDRARYWLEQCAPESANHLRATRNWAVWQELSAEEQQEIALLHDLIRAGGYDLDEFNSRLYAIPRQIWPELDDKEIKTKQKEFFRSVYRLLIDKEQGPRLYLFLYAIETERYLGLLDFSYPVTEAELQAEAEARAAAEAAAAPKKKVRGGGEPDPVAPIEPEQVSLDQFFQSDLRVCKITKCADIRKSHSCYKLTLDDGLGERVIVSSIKGEYEPEELIGRKIIVVANLEPTRITGVNSQGMLLAATNAACGCQIIFVDDCVPVGTRIK